MASEPTDEMVDAARDAVDCVINKAEARRAITAALAVQERTHVWVPREPTPAMLAAAGKYADFCAAHNYGGCPDNEGIWDAMLAASTEDKP